MPRKIVWSWICQEIHFKVSYDLLPLFLVYYHIFLDIENKALGDAVLIWKEGTNNKELKIPEGVSVKRLISLSGPEKDQSIQLKGYDERSRSAVHLNGRKLLLIKPMRDKQLHKVLIEEGNWIGDSVFSSHSN